MRASSVKPPAAPHGKVVPWTTEQVAAVRHALPDRYRAMATLAAGCGLRQGEVFGLGLEDVNCLRRFLHVRRQVKFVGGQYVFALPKVGKTREVPLPDSVALALSAHIAAHPPRGATLLWERPDGNPLTVQLVAGGTVHPHLTADHYDTAWAAARKSAGVE